MTTYQNFGSVPQRPAHLFALLWILAVGVSPPCAGAVAVIVWGGGGSGSVVTNVPADLSNVVAVTAGSGHSLALRADGTVVGWGASNAPSWPYAGRLDIPSDLLHDAVAVAAGVEHSLVLRANGTVLGWGSIFNGDPWMPFSIPPGLSNVVAIATGTFHSMALKIDGTVTTWGHFFGSATTPCCVSNVVAIAAETRTPGSYGGNCLALRSDGTVVAWNFRDGELTTIRPGLTNIVAIASGNAHSIALRGDGTVVAWGTNDFGQTDVPPGLSNVVAIAAGSRHNLALRSDGRIVGWGSDSSGQVSGSRGLSNVVGIAGGASFSIALIRQVSIPDLWLELAAAFPDLELQAHGTHGISSQLLRATRLEGPWLPTLPVTFTNALHTIPMPNADEPAQFFLLQRR